MLTVIGAFILFCFILLLAFRLKTGSKVSLRNLILGNRQDESRGPLPERPEASEASYMDFGNLPPRPAGNMTTAFYTAFPIFRSPSNNPSIRPQENGEATPPFPPAALARSNESIARRERSTPVRMDLVRTSPQIGGPNGPPRRTSGSTLARPESGGDIMPEPLPPSNAMRPSHYVKASFDSNAGDTIMGQYGTYRSQATQGSRDDQIQGTWRSADQQRVQNETPSQTPRQSVALSRYSVATSVESAPRFRTVNSWVSSQASRAQRKVGRSKENDTMPLVPEKYKFGTPIPPTPADQEEEEDNYDADGLKRATHVTQTTATQFRYHPGEEVKYGEGSVIESEVLDANFMPVAFAGLGRPKTGDTESSGSSETIPRR
jgi:hypothetical protein